MNTLTRRSLLGRLAGIAGALAIPMPALAEKPRGRRGPEAVVCQQLGSDSDPVYFYFSKPDYRRKLWVKRGGKTVYYHEIDRVDNGGALSAAVGKAAKAVGLESWDGDDEYKIIAGILLGRHMQLTGRQ